LKYHFCGGGEEDEEEVVEGAGMVYIRIYVPQTTTVPSPYILICLNFPPRVFRC
jgi:hypothetical protein